MAYTPPQHPPQPPPKPFPWLGFALGVGAVYTGFKLIQAITDEEYEGQRTLPRSRREALKFEHIAKHGSFCPGCGLRTTFADLHVNHRYPYSKGGRTSVNNSRVICKWCNLAKGAQVNLLDFLLGRGGRNN